MSDIFEIPELQNLLDSFPSPDDDEAETPDESDAEIAGDADNEAVSEGAEDEQQSQDDYNSEQVKNDPLELALQQAIAEQQQTTMQLQQQLALNNLRAQAPQLVPFEELTEEQQAAVIAEADRANVDPQTVLYTRYRSDADRFEQQVSQLDAQIQAQRQQAFSSVRTFVRDNEHVAAMSEADRAAFIAEIGEMDAIKDLEPLALIDPQRWARSVTRIAAERIAAVAAKKIVKADTAKQQQAMKASVSSGKTTSAAKVSTPQERAAQFVLSAAASHQSWDKRLKPKT